VMRYVSIIKAKNYGVGKSSALKPALWNDG
jgi:hypothetical protein